MMIMKAINFMYKTVIKIFQGVKGIKEKIDNYYKYYESA
jgi:hypothetical protein